MGESSKSRAPAASSKTSMIMMIIAIVVLIALGIGLYFVWHKSGTTALDAKVSASEATKATQKISELEKDIKMRDDKISEQAKELGDLRTSLVELKYQMKEVRKSVGMRVRVQPSPSTPPATTSSKKEPACTDTGCEMHVEDIDDLDD